MTGEVSHMNETVVTEYRPLTFVTGFHEVRPINHDYLKRLRQKITEIGAKPYPLSVTPDGVLYGGRHRYEAFKAIGITHALMHISAPANLDREAIELNKASEDALPMTFVDYAELIWRRLESKQTQQQVADGLGWSRESVKNYSALQKIDREAWDIVGTSFQKIVPSEESDSVPINGTNVPSQFTEGLLRNILDLCRGQQFELCALLAKGKDRKGHKFSKAEFKALAERYRTRNALIVAANDSLDAIPHPALIQYLAAVQSQIDANVEYVDEYLKYKKPGPKFERLIQAQLDEWQEQSNVRLIIKDIRLLLDEDIPAESVDVIITDPPYPADYIDLFDTLGELAARVLKPGGSLIAMTGQRYLPQYINLLGKHLKYHWTLAYHTPGGQAVQLWSEEVNTFWKPVLWFVKDERDARWVSDFISTPVNANDKEHHKWGQSIPGMRAIVERFSNQGDVILDPFLGGGTTGLVAKQLKRKFIGVEIDEETAKAAIQRIHEGGA